MAKIKIPTSKAAVEEAKSKGDFEDAPPGLYVAKIKELNDGYSKDATTGKPDKSRRRLEVVLTIIGEGRDNSKLEKNYSQLWRYISFSDESEWQRAELMVALGKSLKKSGFEIETDADKPGTDVGKTVLVRVKADGNTTKAAKLLPFVGEVEDDEDVYDDEEEEADEDDEEVEDEDEDEELPFGCGLVTTKSKPSC